MCDCDSCYRNPENRGGWYKRDYLCFFEDEYSGEGHCPMWSKNGRYSFLNAPSLFDFRPPERRPRPGVSKRRGVVQR